MSILLYSTTTLVIIIACVYSFFKRKHTYWSKKGIYTEPPVVPFGNIRDMMLTKMHFALVYSKAYLESKPRPFVGVYAFHRPVLVINDLDIVRDVLTKDFPHFTDRGMPFDPELDPISAHLFNMNGAAWKSLRTRLTPTFTSSKMRSMFDTMTGCADQLVEYLDTLPGRVGDVKDIAGMFTNEVIASCAFGIECNTFKNPDDKFREMGKRIFNPSLRGFIVGSLAFLAPGVNSLLRLRLLDQDLEDFFYKVVEETITFREKNNIVRNDFMQLLIEMRRDDANGKNPQSGEATSLTMMQLAAQVFVFYVAGFDTSSSAISFALYELSLNPEIQRTLMKEIDETLDKYNGKITYESLIEMSYLNKVIDETLRKYPSVPILFRECTRDYVLPNTSINIEKGQITYIPIYGIHRDPDLYPEPDKFDPERFNPENKKSRHHFAYLPFGEGPRICIGNRFGLMQTRLALVSILSKFEVAVCDKTAIPINYQHDSFVLTCDGGLWLEIKRRVK